MFYLVYMSKIFSIIFSILAVSCLVNLAQVSAATSSIREEAFGQLGAAGGTSGAGLSSTDPRILAARIIKVALSILGTVFLVLVLYAGFLWMTAGGEDGKIETAKKLLSDAVIGLAIILSAYAITFFVFDVVLKGSTNGGQNQSNSTFCLQNPLDPSCTQ